MTVLPQVIAAVAGRAEIWIDGGFMRGSAVVKAISLAQLKPEHLCAAPPVFAPGVLGAFPLLGEEAAGSGTPR